MNAKTAKLLRKYTAGSAGYRPLKRFWRRSPWTQRTAMREHIKRRLEELQ